MKKRTLTNVLLLFFVALGWNLQAQDPCVDCDFSIIDPVCVVEQGDTISLPNLCFLECLGFDSTDVVVCNITLPPDPCNCDFVFDPVCALDATTGETLFFPSACFAECEGYTANEFVVCDSLLSGGGWQVECEAAFYIDYDWTDPLNIEFNDLSLNATSWSWDFGDGNMSTEQNPSHTYAAAGTYDVTLTIENDSCNSTITEIVFIENWTGGGNECDAFFFYSQNNSNSLEVEFVDFSWATGDITSWSWDFGDGNTSTGQNPIHTYAVEGEYEVALTIVADSCTSTITQSVWIGTWGWGNDCYAAFYYYQSDLSVPTVAFTDDSYASGAVTSWAWDFGDGNTSTDQNPVHTYAADGDYIVSLTINTQNSCTSSSEYFVFVGDNSNQVPWTPGNCQSFFLFTQDANDEMTINFEDISITNEPITEWFWDFGDGNTSSEQHPSHTYPTSGVYPVTLSIATDSCQSNFIMLVFAGDDAWYPTGCQALFLPLMSGTDVFLFNLSTSDDNITDYLWDFGDGTTSTVQMPNHTYAAIGDYIITLTITSANGCTSTFTVGVDLLDGFVSSNATQDYMTTTTSTENLSIVGKVKSYPNPATDIFNLELSTSSDKEVQINIRTVNGTQLSGNTYQLNSGENKIQLDVARLISGVYFVEILEGNEVKTIKFIK